MSRLGMTKKRTQYFFRDNIPTYIDALCDCPSHCVGLMDDDAETLHLEIKSVQGIRTPEKIEVLSSYSILHVKMLIRQFTGVLTNAQTLLHAGKALENHQTLEDCGITVGETTLYLTLPV